jgi:hypothetical protein
MESSAFRRSTGSPWGRVGETFLDIGQCHALVELRGEIAHLLGDYYQRNNSYRLEELMEPAARASIVSGEGTTWLVELARSMDAPEWIMDRLIGTPGLTDAQRISLQRDLVAIREKQSEASFGDNREYGVSQATAARLDLVSMLLNAGDAKGASTEWSQIPAIAGRRPRWNVYQFRDQVEIRLASKTGTLNSLLERYASEPDSAPPVDSLRNAALVLRRARQPTRRFSFDCGARRWP